MGRYSATLPILEAMREREAEEAARQDAARVLQRAFGGLLWRAKCRRVCYDLIEVRFSTPGQTSALCAMI